MLAVHRQEYGQIDDADAPVDIFWSSYWTAPFCSYPDRTRDLTSVVKVSDFGTITALRRAVVGLLPPVRGAPRDDGGLPSPLRRSLRLLLSRGPGPDFSERDRGLLALLRPHLDARFQEWQRRRQPVTLTSRQRELLALVAAGRTNRQIARHLRLAEGTVRTHLENIFRRLQVSSRAAAVARAFRRDTQRPKPARRPRPVGGRGRHSKGAQSAPEAQAQRRVGGPLA